MNLFACILLIQADVSSLLSQIKVLQRKNNELDEENRKITSKVKVQIVIYSFIFIDIHKTNALADCSLCIVAASNNGN